MTVEVLFATSVPCRDSFIARRSRYVCMCVFESRGDRVQSVCAMCVFVVLTQAVCVSPILVPSGVLYVVIIFFGR